MIEVFLIPYTVFKWVFSLAFWYYGIVLLTNTEFYEKTSDKLVEKWNAYREK